MKDRVYRSFRRMTDEEQKATGMMTDRECMQTGTAPQSVLLGYDPFIVKIDKTWDELTEEEKNHITSIIGHGMD